MRNLELGNLENSESCCQKYSPNVKTSSSHEEEKTLQGENKQFIDKMLPVEAGGPGVKWLRTMSKMTEAEARIMKSGISDKVLDQPDPTSCC